LKGNEAQGSNDAEGRGNTNGSNRLDDGERPCGREKEPGNRGRINGVKATAAVTQYGCRRGKASEGMNRELGKGGEDCWSWQHGRWEAQLETARTP